MEAAAWGLIGTIIGALASVLTSFLAFKNQAWLHKKNTEQERDSKRRDFQRETLLELQDVIHDLMRLITQGHLEDVKAHLLGGEWGKNFISEEINEGQRLARRKLIILIERVADNKLRENLKELNRALPSQSNTPSMEHAEIEIYDSASRVTKVMSHLGEVLRAQY
ncbi:hypothetical protein [Ectopseudomonas khazarica]|uniref:hypothetical protein n=1 Tax=Ectopseudomonas khazarica TaxID=2502979 RepID=UPI0037C9D2B6